MGYKKVYAPDHPYAQSDGRVYEHRLIIEQQIGRYLEPHEHVHHKDHDTKNNDPTNLEHCPTAKDHYAEHAFDDDFLLELLIRYADIYGYLPTKRQCDEHSQMPHSSTYIRHFGSWSYAKGLALAKLNEMNQEDNDDFCND